MDIVKVIYLSLFGVIAITVTRRHNSEFSFFISCFLRIGITVFSIGILLPVFEYINSLSENMLYGNLTSVLFKSAGICLLCTCACEICNGCGESFLASKIELAGKCTLIAYSLPLIKTVFEYAKSFIS